MHDNHIRYIRDDSSGSDDGDSVTFIVGGTTPQISPITSMPQYPMPTLSSISSIQTTTNSTHPHFSSTDR